LDRTLKIALAPPNPLVQEATSLGDLELAQAAQWHACAPGRMPQKLSHKAMLNTLTPVWDGNETFLVLGGAGLYGAFPIVYSTLLPANYLPLILMVVGLIFRGAAFELRAKADRTQHAWDLASIGGSGIATLCQGIVLGSLLQGTKIVDGRFVGGAFDWLSPFSLFCGIGLLVTYASLGCGWLILKTVLVQMVT
jgi:cytochrome d ubiquinol oxidase subunit II